MKANIWIAGTGAALPGKVLTNADLAGMVETSDEWIFGRTGIRERRILGPGETLSGLCAQAVSAAMKNADVSPEEIGLIVAGTSTADRVFPGCACEVQAAVGADGACCLDVSAACSGFLYALHTAEALMRTDGIRTAAVIGADRLSQFLDWQDRSTCVLFGDGAGAVILKTGDGSPGTEQSGDILGTLLFADGTGKDFLTCGREAADPFIRMRGQEVFLFAVRSVSDCIRKVLEKTGIEKENVRYYILHQANSRILTAVAKRLNEPPEKFPMNMMKTANTSAASIPLLLDEMNRDGRLHRGDLLVLAGFGAGLTWGASVIRC